jgi:hypothetical protein
VQVSPQKHRTAISGNALAWLLRHEYPYHITDNPLR